MSDRAKLVIYKILLTVCVCALVYAYRYEIREALFKNETSEAVLENINDGLSNGTALPDEGGTEGTVTGPDTSVSSVYTDERTPDYSIVNTLVNDPAELEFTWNSYEGLYYATISYRMDIKLYEYYKGLSRYYGDNEYINYITESVNDKYIEMLTENLSEIAGRREYTEGELVRETINFVQSFAYVEDEELTGRVEWPKYPVEMLYERAGDCEDSSLLLAGILRKMNYGVCLIKYPDHMAVGLKGDDSLSGASFNYEGNDYYYIETTNPGWEIGEMPEEYKGLEATIIVIN